MSEKGFGRELAEELIGKAAVCAVPLATGILFGPAAVIAGVVTAAVVVASGTSSDRPAGNASQSNEPGSSPCS